MTLGDTHAFLSPDSAKAQRLDWANLADCRAPEPNRLLPEWGVAPYRARHPTWSPTDIFSDATTAGRSWRGQVIEAEARAQAGAPGFVHQVDFTGRVDLRRGAPRGIAISPVFGTISAAGSQTATAADACAASKALQNSFVAFAATGDPNHAGLPNWPRDDLASRSTMLFAARATVENAPRRRQRELFGPVPCITGAASAGVVSVRAGDS